MKRVYFVAVQVAVEPPVQQQIIFILLNGTKNPLDFLAIFKFHITVMWVFATHAKNRETTPFRKKLRVGKLREK